MLNRALKFFNKILGRGCKSVNEHMINTYLVEDRYLIIYPMSLTTEGVWICTSPYVRLDDLENNLVIGEVMRRCLKESDKMVSHPKQDEWKDLFRPVLEIAKITSRKVFNSNSILVNVSGKPQHELILEPNQYVLQSKSYEAVKEKIIKLPATVGDEELGKSLMEAFSYCK